MKQYFLSSIVLLVLFPIEITAQIREKRDPTTPQLRISALGDFDPEEGCRCYFGSPSDRHDTLAHPFFFMSSLDHQVAWMRINDSITEFYRFDTIRGTTGLHFSEVFSNDSIFVYATFTIESGPWEQNEDNEFSWMNATITVRIGKQKKTIRVHGGCGC